MNVQKLSFSYIIKFDIFIGFLVIFFFCFGEFKHLIILLSIGLLLFSFNLFYLSTKNKRQSKINTKSNQIKCIEEKPIFIYQKIVAAVFNLIT